MKEVCDVGIDVLRSGDDPFPIPLPYRGQPREVEQPVQEQVLLFQGMQY